ncbi:MAG: type II toxin-antitoxin system VapC family toxin [Gemmatimonadetes bacterium]|nr:type II toxin-antitoxin system VapC family toxin [Gemmatimonadota bacterium]MYA64168.1 type II toxin-antitoxin system VapC family toxin [Gemmatimonadota bacterium]MYB98544.1 type II toxin-antitoxin system VapC family toxin [Gemmatimonadota bacterium]MYH54223.1 type II toxin-antitoxin system VapC family toxin [Gemmatimonadota bacterium]MYI44845.1 type II toxin-antitoxin system VapC family toxin [Gemmatimonadota bacterium]
MSFVLDCSVAMSWVFPDEATDATDQLRESLVDGRAFVPALWPIEVANVLLVATRRQRIDRTEWPRIARNLEALPLVIDPVSTSRIWGEVLDVARTHRLSAYDAMYLELAIRMQLPLATLDRALATAARAAGVAVPTVTLPE